MTLSSSFLTDPAMDFWISRQQATLSLRVVPSATIRRAAVWDLPEPRPPSMLL